MLNLGIKAAGQEPRCHKTELTYRGQRRPQHAYNMSVEYKYSNI